MEFDYVDISEEIRILRLEVEDMTDIALIEEVSDFPFSDDQFNEIIHRYAFYETPLTNEEREKLIGCYILLYSELDLEL